MVPWARESFGPKKTDQKTNTTTLPIQTQHTHKHKHIHKHQAAIRNRTAMFRAQFSNVVIESEFFFGEPRLPNWGKKLEQKTKWRKQSPPLFRIIFFSVLFFFGARIPGDGGCSSYTIATCANCCVGSSLVVVCLSILTIGIRECFPFFNTNRL